MFTKQTPYGVLSSTGVDRRRKELRKEIPNIFWRDCKTEFASLPDCSCRTKVSMHIEKAKREKEKNCGGEVGLWVEQRPHSSCLILKI